MLLNGGNNMKKVLLVLLALAVIAPTAAFAGGDGKCSSCCLDFKASPWTTGTTWSEKAVGKLQFGIKNLFAGWTEIFTEPKEAIDNKTCVIQGFFRGCFNALIDEVGGVLHTATFPITGLDVPLPEGGTSVGS